MGLLRLSLPRATLGRTFGVENPIRPLIGRRPDIKDGHFRARLRYATVARTKP